MDDVIITVDNDKRSVAVNPRTIAICGENLQGRFIVEFSDSFVGGISHLDFLICSTGEKKYIPLTLEESNTYYSCDIESPITEHAGKIKMQLVVYQDNGGVFKSSIFEVYVEEGINATEKAT